MSASLAELLSTAAARIRTEAEEWQALEAQVFALIRDRRALKAVARARLEGLSPLALAAIIPVRRLPVGVILQFNGYGAKPAMVVTPFGACVRSATGLRR